jgi:hypothetical protein
MVTRSRSWPVPSYSTSVTDALLRLSEIPVAGVAVRLKVAEPVTPVTVAVTVMSPGVEPMVRVTEAFPSLPVVAVVELSVAAPAGLTAKVTVAPGKGLPLVLFT